MTVTFFFSFLFTRRSIFMRYLSNKYIDRIHTHTHKQKGRTKHMHTHTNFPLMNGGKEIMHCVLCWNVVDINENERKVNAFTSKDLFVLCPWNPLYTPFLSIAGNLLLVAAVVVVACRLLYSFVCQTRGYFPRWLPWFDFLIKKEKKTRTTKIGQKWSAQQLIHSTLFVLAI